jgi:cell pole-organizing protein PopZ
MEEILASIRRMITEEDPARGRAASAESARDPAGVSGDDDVLELTEALDDPRPAAPSRPAAGDDEPVLSSASANAALAALARLSAAAPPAAVTAKSQTVDDLVRELLRPMLKDWLDANLPRLVEQAVEREVSRIASGAVRR